MPTPAEVLATLARQSGIEVPPERAATAAESAANLARQAAAGARWLTFESEPSNYAERLAASAPRS